MAIDAGTTNCRVSVFEPGGALVTHASRGCPVRTDADGAAEQDAAAVWEGVRDLLRRAVSGCGGRPVRAVSLSVQGDAVIALDGRGEPLHPAILGMDYRPAPQARDAERALGGRRLFRRTGMRPHPLTSVCKIMWLREKRPEIFRQARRLVTYADFLLGRLGAEPAIDDTMASRTMGLELTSGQWSSWALGGLGIDPALLSPVVRSGAVVGRMSRQLARQIGLTSEPSIVAGAHDQVCAAIGAGVPLRGRSVVSTGTAEVLSAVLDRPVLSRAMYDGHYPCYRYAAPGLWFTFSLNHAGGILLSWFRDLVGGQDDGFERLLGGLPGGTSPVMVLPHFDGSGTPWCDLASRGAILGLTLSTKPGDITLAILESLAFELRVNRDRLRAAGVALGETAAVGGGARSDAWLQIKADVLGQPLRKPGVEDAAALGAAILAGVGTGLFASVNDGIAAMEGPARSIEPRPAMVELYDERFGLYREIYPALSPVNRRLSRQ
jgi:xylulokinase